MTDETLPATPRPPLLQSQAPEQRLQQTAPAGSCLCCCLLRPSALAHSLVASEARLPVTNAASRAPPRDQSQPQALGSRPGNPRFNKPQWDSDASPGLGAPPLLMGQDRHLSWLVTGGAVFGRGCFGNAQPLAWSCSSLQCRAWWWALMPLGTS